jgi:hypothetical protein
MTILAAAAGAGKKTLPELLLTPMICQGTGTRAPTTWPSTCWSAAAAGPTRRPTKNRMFLKQSKLCQASICTKSLLLSLL